MGYRDRGGCLSVIECVQRNQTDVEVLEQWNNINLIALLFYTQLE